MAEQLRDFRRRGGMNDRCLATSNFVSIDDLVRKDELRLDAVTASAWYSYRCLGITRLNEILYCGWCHFGAHGLSLRFVVFLRRG